MTVPVRVSSTTAGLGVSTPMSLATGSAKTGGSGRLTWVIGRFSESRGMAASSPTPGRPTPESGYTCSAVPVAAWSSVALVSR